MRTFLRHLSLASVLALTLVNTGCRPAEDACGDGTIGEAEACDDGNTADGDGCSATCTSDETCGNGAVDTVVGEACDDGNTADGDGCSATCTSDETCGNGTLDAAVGEICDDGNTADGDGCSATCISDETCGNGTLDAAVGEACDDGNTADGDGCTATCALPSCGDGVLDDGEVCDDGNTDAADGCNATCTSDESCGNSILDTPAGEACDDGNTDAADGCSPTCQVEECGNAVVDAGEICDDGNEAGGDGCAADCLSDETCGNSTVDTAAGEVCDDGNTDAADGCSSDCLSNETCGNGVMDTSVGEVCDDGNGEGGDGCSSDCLSDETCGNDIVDVTEDCDDGNTSGGDGCAADCDCPIDVCDNTCVDTETDEAHCGECGTTCSNDETCYFGDCVTCVPGVIVTKLTIEESDGWRSDVCCRRSDYLVAQAGDTLSASFDDAVPPGAVVTGITVEAGIEHACNSQSDAMEFKLNGVTIGTWGQSDGPDCSCGNPAVGTALFDADPAAYLPGDANIVSIDHNSTGNCHEAVTNVPGESENTLFVVTLTYGCE